MNAWLSARRRRTLASLVDTLVPGSTAAQAVEEHLAGRNALARHAVSLALDALEWGALGFGGERFSRSDAERRHALVQRCRTSKLGALRAGVRAAAALTYLVHYRKAPSDEP